jgi:PilZ domain
MSRPFQFCRKFPLFTSDIPAYSANLYFVAALASIPSSVSLFEVKVCARTGARKWGVHAGVDLGYLSASGSEPMMSGMASSVSPRAFKRRSVRIQLKIQLVLETGDDSILDGETVTVSRHGARIRITSSRGHLTVGERLRVRMRRGKEALAARVVWIDKRTDPHYGLELEGLAQNGNFWGVSFPSKDEPRTSRRAAGAATGAPHASKKPAGSSSAVPSPPAPMPKDDVGNKTINALISGFSAVSVPFAERVEMIFLHSEEAHALLKTVVEPGAELRVTFADKSTTKARVMTVGQREAGRCPVRVRCESASA